MRCLFDKNVQTNDINVRQKPKDDPSAPCTDHYNRTWWKAVDVSTFLSPQQITKSYQLESGIVLLSIWSQNKEDNKTRVSDKDNLQVSLIWDTDCKQMAHKETSSQDKNLQDRPAEWGLLDLIPNGVTKTTQLGWYTIKWDLTGIIFAQFDWLNSLWIKRLEGPNTLKCVYMCGLFVSDTETNKKLTKLNFL